MRVRSVSGTIFYIFTGVLNLFLVIFLAWAMWKAVPGQSLNHAPLVVDRLITALMCFICCRSNVCQVHYWILGSLCALHSFVEAIITVAALFLGALNRAYITGPLLMISLLMTVSALSPISDRHCRHLKPVYIKV